MDTSGSEEEALYKHVIEHMQEVLYRCDNEEKITLISPAALKMFGYDSLDELNGQKIREVFYHQPSDRDPLVEELERKGKVVNFPLVLKRKDGSRLYARTTSYFRCNKSGQRLGVEGIIMDYSEQYLAEQALQQAADIVEHINLGIFIFKLEDPEDDHSLRLISANPATEKLLGIPVTSLLGQTLDESFPGLREKGIPRMFADVVREQKAQEIDELDYEDHRVPAGIFSVKAFPLPNQQLAISLENITRRKHVEEALRKSEEKHRQLIEVMNEGFVVLNKQGLITYANKRLCEMMDYSQQELLGRPTTDFLDQENTGNMQKHVASRTQGKSIPYEAEWLKKDGSVLPTLVSPMPLFDAAGDFCGNVAVLTDISELKKAEKELIKKNDELEAALHRANKMQEHLILTEKMASLGQITAGVAHEIKNPLGYILGNIGPLKRDVKDLLAVLKSYASIVQKRNIQDLFTETESLKHELEFTEVIQEIHLLLKGMQEGADRTAQIVKSLGEFSRVGEEEAVKADIHPGIDSTLMLLSRELGNRIRIKKEYGPLPELECFPGKLNQVFMNILANAIQAIDQEGEIVIRTAAEEKQVTIRIADNGKGMPDELRKRIFEPFFTTKEMGKGAGLGLSISYQIIAQHQGSIDVLSEPGKGTEFIITLPRTQSN